MKNFSASSYLFQDSLTLSINGSVSDNDGAWTFYILLFILILATFVWAAFKKGVKNQIKAARDLRTAEQLYRRREKSVSIHVVLMMLLFFFSSGLYISLLLEHFNLFQSFGSFTLFIFSIAAIIAVYTVKHLLLKIQSAILPFSNEISFFSYNIALVNRSLGLLLMPFIIMMLYSFDFIAELSMKISFLIILLVVLYVYRKGFIIGRQYLRFYKFHFFVYFCTSEILPLVMLIKLLGQLNKIV